MKKSLGVGLVVLFVVSIVALIPAMPGVSLPKEDSGIFVYFGRQILDGQMPYRDLFDHKPPMVFYLNALGVALGGLWGVWGVQLAGIFLASVGGFLALRRYYGAWTAGLAVGSFLFNLVLVLERGNLTEEYALPFQFAALALFAGPDDQRGWRWRSYLLGACGGAAFMLRQNLIGLWLALAVIVTARAVAGRNWRGLLELLRWAGGALAVIGLWVGYFAVTSNLAAFWDVAFLYNFVYSSVSNVERLAALEYSLWFISQTSGFFLIAALAWLASLAALLIYHSPTRRVATNRWLGLGLALLGLFIAGRALAAAEAGISGWRAQQIIAGGVLAALGGLWLTGWAARRIEPWLARLQPSVPIPLEPLFIAVLGAPLELGLISLSAASFAHYFMAVLPAFTILIAFFLDTLMRWGRGAKRNVLAYVWLALFLIPINQNGAAALIAQGQTHWDEQTVETVAYIKAQTQPDDPILVWGFNTGLYYLSERQSPTRFMMQGPLFKEGYTSKAKVEAFLGELKANPPRLIIDTRLYPFVNPEVGEACKLVEGKPPAGMSEVFGWVCDNYELIGPFGRDNWLIYRLEK